MPHQCLKCGTVFADGSPEILRGFPSCSGTRFFYTEKPLPEEERTRLKEQANKDIKYLIQEMMSGDTLPMNFEKESKEKNEWVSIGIRGDGEAKKSEIKEKSKVQKSMVKSVEDLVFPKEKDSKKFRFASKADTHKKMEKTAVTQKPAAKQVPRAPEAKNPKKKERVEVISISDEGVYDIDVEKLLEKSPIIVAKDGSYMVHLPSVFKMVKKKESSA
jgi:predicted  nucleic acid-binding Zn-ribbon protein